MFVDPALSTHACVLRNRARTAVVSIKTELVNFNGGRVQPQSLDPKHALVFRVEIGGHMVCVHMLQMHIHTQIHDVF